MRKLRRILFTMLTVIVLMCFVAQPAFALEESEVQAQVDAVGKEAVAGNVLIWFLCAIAFLKVSQKIDSFMSSLGINVGHTGGSMLSEAMIAARSIGGFRGSSGGRSGRSSGASGGGGEGFLAGGLAGVVSRQVTSGAVKSVTSPGNGSGASGGTSASGGIGGSVYASSVAKGGSFANKVIGSVAMGDISTMGSITGTETNPETGDESAAEEKWLVYSITYNGERYFAEHIFQLTDAQKELADEYAYNLNLFLSDGMFQELGDWDGSGIPSLGNVHFTDGITEVVYYNQLDERYADKPYGTDNIGGYGCGPTSMAIVVSSLTDEIVDPIQMAQWSYENGYWCEKSGSYHALIPAAARNWGLPVSGCTAAEPQRILDALAEGKLIVALMRKGHFTSSGHFIVLRGVKDGKIMVADPSSYTRSEQLWDLEIFLDEAGHGAGAGGPFWIIG